MIRTPSYYSVYSPNNEHYSMIMNIHYPIHISIILLNSFNGICCNIWQTGGGADDLCAVAIGNPCHHIRKDSHIIA